METVESPVKALEISEAIMFEEGDFEVVDECTGEEDPAPCTDEKDKQSTAPSNAEKASSTAKKAAVTAEAAKPLENVQSQKQGNSQANKVGGTAAKTPAKANPQNGNKNRGIDFTADISMDNEENAKEEAMDDEAIQLDIGDSLILDECDDKPEAAKDKAEGDDKKIEAADSAAESKEAAAPVVLPEHAWYEEKINTKLGTVKERLSKLARVLELSYPAYKPWLEHSKDPVCHLEPPRRCPLDRPHTNRWKFICSRKPVQESTNKEEDSAEGTVNKKVETVWRLGPTDGSGVNTDNASQYPPFVMRVVKVFEEFIQSVDTWNDRESEEAIKEEDATAAPEAEAKKDSAVAAGETTPEEGTAPESKPEAEDASDAKEESDPKEETPSEEKGSGIDRNHNWLWLLVRCNSKDELMVFATGKKISHATMEKLKETFESGPGKDCNVKSLYCKSIAKTGNTTTTNITFLAGSEALDETVAGLKIQLAPKTNFWCNAAGVETLGSAVGDLLSPMPKSTVVEVGCGLGLLGLMIAPKCRQVIGLDAPSEVEEAEMTSELNKITNTTFVMGQPNEMMTKVSKLLKNTKASAIINANTKIGRAIEVMTALRKCPTLRRVVMITTLTKQSVRAILELTRPADGDLGNPFMPVRAVLVDTLPTGPHFEVVIRMERLIMQKMHEPWFWNHVQFRAGLAPHLQQQRATKNDKSGAANKTNKSPAKVQAKKSGVKGSPPTKQPNADKSLNKRANNRANKRNKMKKQKAAGQGVVVGSRIVVGPGLVTGVVKNAPKNLVKNPLAVGAKSPTKNPPKNAGKGSAKGKRPHSPDRGQGGTAKKFVKNKPGGMPSQATTNSPASPNPQQSNKTTKPNKPKVQSPLKKNPLARVPPRGQGGNAAQKRKRNWGPDGSNMRGQPLPEKRMRENAHHADLRNRLSDGRMDPALLAQVQEQQMLLNMAQQRLGAQGQVDVDTAKQLQNMLNIVLEQTNKLQNQLPRSVWDRIAPPGHSEYSPPPHNMQRDPMMFRDRFVQDVGPQDILITTQNREFEQQNQGPPPLFPNNRPPMQSSQIMPAGITSMDIPPLGNSRGRPERSQGRDYRKQQNQGNNWQRQGQFEKNRGSQQTMNKPPPLSAQLETNARGSSPKRPLLSPPRNNAAESRRYMPPFPPQTGELRRPHSPPRRQMSPPRRQMSPPRRQMSPPRNQGNNAIFQRRPAAQQGRQQQQQQQQQQQHSADVQRRGISPPRQREQAPAARPMSPVRRFGDEWDIPNRGALEQGNWHQRQIQQQQQQQQQPQQQQQRSNDRNAQRPANAINWDNNSSANDRFRNNAKQDKWEGKEGTWMGASGDIWNSKSSAMKPGNKEQWSQGQNDKQWGAGGNNQGSGGDHWGMRGKDNYGQSNNRMDNWGAGNKDKEDWSDLPEDARDPWGDDGGQGGKSRRQQADKNSAGNWGRDNKDKMDQNWMNKMGGGNWQNKGMSMGGNKPQWPSMGNQNSNDQRWGSLNDGLKKSTDNWQSNNSNSMNNWRPQQNFVSYPQLQRQNPFGSNNFKDGR